MFEQDSEKQTAIAADELEAIRLAQMQLPQYIKRLQKIAKNGTDSQARQAIEVLLKYALTDRQQQLDVENGKIIGSNGGNVTLNKIDVNLIGIMNELPPELKIKLTQVMDEIESFAKENEIGLIDGNMVSTNTCKCGCGEIIPEGNTWAQGHHAKSHVAHPNIKAARQKFTDSRKRVSKSKKEESE